MITYTYLDFEKNKNIFFDLVVNSKCIKINIHIHKPATYNVKVEMELIMSNLLELQKEHNKQLCYTYPDTTEETGIRYIVFN